MAAFGLDDVRELYTSDVTRFLTDVETSASIIASAAALAVSADCTRQAPVDSVVVGLHGIAGSSSLIGLDTMTGTARRLEALAVSAAESIRLMTWHATRLQRIASVCRDSTGDLRAILEHELAGRSGDAHSRSAALHAKLDVSAADLQPPSNGEAARASRASGAPIVAAAVPAFAQDSTADRGWDADLVEPTAAVPPPADGDDELRQAFRDEARETLTHLQGHWTRLHRDPDDDEAAAQCVRLLHLLRGSAAMVGQVVVASRTGELHGWLETVRMQGFTAAAVAALGRGIEDLGEQVLGERPVLVSAAAPRPPSAGSGAGGRGAIDRQGEPAAPAEDDEPRQIFLEEARRALGELRTLTGQLEHTPGAGHDATATRAERVLHRLKGSALIVGEPQIAELAARGQTLCEPDHVGVEALAALIEEIAARVDAAAPAAADAPLLVAAASVIRFTPPSAEEWDAYLEESSALLDDLERALAKLEQSARPTAELSAMFRMYHTLKGASSSVGLAPIGQQLHAIETFVERIVAAPELPPLRAVVAALADEHAAMRANIARASAHGTLEIDTRSHALLAAIGERATLSAASWIAASDPIWATPVWDGADGEASRDPHASRSHASQLAPAALATPAAAAPADDEPSLDAEPAVGRRFVRVAADRLDGLLDLVGELVVARSRMLTRIARLTHLQDEDQDRHGTVIRLVDDFATSTEFVDLDGHRTRPGGRTRRGVGTTSAATGRGPSHAGFGALELDHYEEIHVLSRQLDEAASDIHEMRREIAAEMQRLTQDADALSTVIADLQTEITQARMLTIETLFTRLQLPIRDAAQRLGREVEITTQGEHVAIDKSISDALFGPLLHIVRNAVVHGIEDPARRGGLGKPRAGVLSLSARQDHGQVVLEITDDGQGLDTARLKAAGVARGLIDPAIPESDPRVLELVFVHGLSTSDEAGHVAGRGVGGNVIRRAVDRLSGSIEIATHRGTGTTFRISLPLSMSITQAVVVRAAGVTLAIPIAFAETILAREGVEAVETFGRARVRIAGNLMPVHHAPRLFGEPAGAAAGVLVVCTIGGERIAIHADEVVGQEEIVVKTLGSLLDGHPLFSGSTQRGDGELVLILDVPGVLAAETAGGAADTFARPGVEPSSRASDARDRAVAVHEPAPSAEPHEAAPADAAPALIPIPTGQRRVLFVDDSLSVRKVAERMLRSLGVDVITAVDGQDALDKLRTMAFSLVFTDLEMPRLHGYELIREMQYLPTYAATPIVVISSRSGQKHIDQALAMGAREYITKPFSSEILSAVLARWTKRQAVAS